MNRIPTEPKDCKRWTNVHLFGAFQKTNDSETRSNSQVTKRGTKDNAKNHFHSVQQILHVQQQKKESKNIYFVFKLNLNKKT